MAETIFDESTLGTSNNQITFNDDNGTIYYRLKNRVPQRREIREFDIPLQENTGIADFQTFIGKTMFILEGTMYPDDEDSFAEGRQALRKLASMDIEQNDNDSDHGYVPYKWTDNSAKQLFMKVMYVDLPENSKQGIKQPFRLFCKIKYPVILSQDSNAGTIGSSTATTSGSFVLPEVLPAVLGATTYSSNGSVTNDGDWPSYPSFSVVGPINVPKITNTTTGEYIEINTNLNSSSDVLTINYDADSLTVEVNGTSVIGSLTSGSTYFKIQPGINNLTLSGSSVGSGAYATVSINSAWPLS
jgi:hypothetical protein